MHLSTALIGRTLRHALDTTEPGHCPHCGTPMKYSPQGWIHPGTCRQSKTKLLRYNAEQTIRRCLQNPPYVIITHQGVIDSDDVTGHELTGVPQIITNDGRYALLLPGDVAPNGLKGLRLDAEYLALPDCVMIEQADKAKRSKKKPPQRPQPPLSEEILLALSAAEQHISTLTQTIKRKKLKHAVNDYPYFRAFPMNSELAAARTAMAFVQEHPEYTELSKQHARRIDAANSQLADAADLEERWQHAASVNQAALDVEVRDTRPGSPSERTLLLSLLDALRPQADSATMARAMVGTEEALLTADATSMPELQRVLNRLPPLIPHYRLDGTEVQRIAQELRASHPDLRPAEPPTDPATATEPVQPHAAAAEAANITHPEESQVLEHLLTQLARSGQSRQTLTALWASLRYATITILTGPSGSGKSSLLRKVAQINQWHHQLIPVHPEWSSSADLLGRVNVLTNELISGPLSRVIFQAHQHPNQMHLAVLDELNLTVPEYLLSEIISGLEHHEPHVNITSPELAAAQPNTPFGEWIRTHRGTVPWPRNLVLSATANDDHTTHEISDRLRDRAGLLELKTPRSAQQLIQLSSRQQAPMTTQQVTHATLQHWDTQYATLSMPEDAQQLLEQVLQTISDLDPDALSLRSARLMTRTGNLLANSVPDGHAAQDVDVACAISAVSRAVARARRDRDTQRSETLRITLSELLGPDSLSAQLC